MRVLIADWKAQAGQGEEVAGGLRRMAEAVREAEPGCVRYDVIRLDVDPDRFIIYEQYRDQEALDAHAVTPHFRTIVEAQLLPLLERRERMIGNPLH